MEVKEIEVLIDMHFKQLKKTFNYKASDKLGREKALKFYIHHARKVSEYANELSSIYQARLNE